MSDILGILIPLGFVAFILYIVDTQIHWFKHFMNIMEWFKSSIVRWSR